MTIDPVGKRVSLYRRARGFKTAAALAEAIENPALTTAVVQNVESGRKSDLTVAQLLDIAFALRVTPAFLIAPVNQMGDRFEYPNVGAEVANLTVQEALAWMTGRMNAQGLTNPTEGFIRNVVHHTDVLSDAMTQFPLYAAAADAKEPIEYFQDEDPDTGRVYTREHDPNAANEYLAASYARDGEAAYQWLAGIERFDLTWASRPWASTKWHEPTENE